jgi:hypothetical protein
VSKRKNYLALSSLGVFQGYLTHCGANRKISCIVEEYFELQEQKAKPGTTKDVTLLEQIEIKGKRGG